MYMQSRRPVGSYQSVGVGVLLSYFLGLSFFFHQRGEPRSNGKKKTSLHILLDYHLKMARTVVICLHGALVVHMTGRFYVLSVVSFS